MRTGIWATFVLAAGWACNPASRPPASTAVTANIAPAPPAPVPSAEPACTSPFGADSLLEELQQVTGEAPQAAYNRLLERSGFAPLEVVEGIPEETLWSLEEARIQDLRLKPGGREKLLSLRFDYGAFRSAARIALLEQRGDELCLVSRELSRDIDGFSCLSDGDPPMTIEPRHIVSASWETLVVTTRSGTCDGYSMGRGAHHEVELWGFVDQDFKQLFRTETFDAWYSSPTPPLRTFERTLQFTGEPPQSILLTTDVTCDRQPEHDPAEECEPRHEESRVTYQDGSYR
ncbi:MAG: hypothetical protein R3B89_05295 [Polyangiaceae bacterium]